MVRSSGWTADDNRELARRLRHVAQILLGLGGMVTVFLAISARSSVFITALGSLLGFGSSFLIVFFQRSFGLPYHAGPPEFDARVQRHFAEARALRQRGWLLALNLPLLALLALAAAWSSGLAPVGSDCSSNLIGAIFFAFMAGVGMNIGVNLLSIEQAIRRQYPEQFQAMPGR